MKEVILTRKFEPIKVTFIGVDWMFKDVLNWYMKRHGLEIWSDYHKELYFRMMESRRNDLHKK